MRKLIAVASQSSDWFARTLESIWSAGDAVLMVDPRLPRDDVLARCRANGAAELVLDDAPPIALEHGTPINDDVAVVMYTSGTSGGPQTVELTHDNLAASARGAMAALGTHTETHWLCCLPVAHIAGFSVVARAVASGAALTCLERFSTQGARHAAESGARAVSLVPTALQRIDPTWFDTILVGGAPTHHVLAPNTTLSYGLTETAGGVVFNGIAAHDVEVRIDESSRICLRGPSIAHHRRDGTPLLAPDNWLVTNDLGLVNEGRLTVLGRADDLIITGGEKVWPQHVEAVLDRLSGVQKSAVTSVDDPEWGQRVVALVELKPGATALSSDQIRAQLGEHLSRWHIPKDVYTVERIPVTSLGKIERHRLGAFIALHLDAQVP